MSMIWRISRIFDVENTHWCTLDQCGSDIAAFIRFGGGLVCEHTSVNILDVLHDGVGGDEAGEGGGPRERDGREEQGGEVGDLHVGKVR